ncbi:hypothetical protein UWK_02688 [Desulfocapsa sulfexigens DSM 10523]|uniref:Uncharacterized protein n=1 Tax=Desulfocapsa sulfexigens (strain DSM 10523 / SB164P1) TaxID=1167006 RepID=M1NI07_DESSD|nr:hypothetical protein UWK_02688 [Desulfocapsa sulfexigens DSM 10523]
MEEEGNDPCTCFSPDLYGCKDTNRIIRIDLNGAEVSVCTWQEGLFEANVNMLYVEYPIVITNEYPR